LIKRETNPERISNYIKKKIRTKNNSNQKRAKRIVANMEDPIQKLIKVMKE
jgi:hypothetical protein